MSEKFYCEICGSDDLAGPTSIFSRRKKNGVPIKNHVFCHDCFVEYYAIAFGILLDEQFIDLSDFKTKPQKN